MTKICSDYITHIIYDHATGNDLKMPASRKALMDLTFPLSDMVMQKSTMQSSLTAECNLEK